MKHKYSRNIFSSFNFYHNLMPRFTRMLNPNARYHLFEKKKGFKAQGKPTVKDVELEMKRFLSKVGSVIQSEQPITQTPFSAVGITERVSHQFLRLDGHTPAAVALLWQIAKWR